MRTCQSCGKENPADRDFCSCGEYLRWEPTSQLKAVTPEMLRQSAATQAAPPTEQAPPTPPLTGLSIATIPRMASRSWTSIAVCRPTVEKSTNRLMREPSATAVATSRDA